MTVQKLNYVDDGPEDHLDVVLGLIDPDSSEDGVSLILVTNMCCMDKCIDPGRNVAAAIEAGVQARICDNCGSQDVGAWNTEAGINTCTECARPLTGGSRLCSICGCLMRVVIMGGFFARTISAAEDSQGGEMEIPLAHPSYHILETPGGVDSIWVLLSAQEVYG